MRDIYTGKYKITCPECGAAVVTALLEAIVWELCPGCGRHIWDRYDTMMADVMPVDKFDVHYARHDQ